MSVYTSYIWDVTTSGYTLKIKFIKDLYVVDLKVRAYKLNISKYKGNWPEWISGSRDLGNINIKLISINIYSFLSLLT